MDKPTETVAACDSTRIRAQWFEEGASLWRLQVQPTVGALAVVVLDIDGEQLVKVTGAEHHDTVGTFGADGADPAFGVGVGSWRSPRGSDDLDSFSFEDLVEGRAEAVVAVMDDESHRFGARFSRFRQITGDLGGPGEIGRGIGDPAGQHATGVQLDEEQDRAGS
jgi:hypothetical protein